MRAAVLVAMVVICPALAHAGHGGAILIPPAEVDVGFGSTLGGAAITGTSAEVLAGMHWASLYWKPTPIDVGLGYVGVRRGMLPGFAERETMPSPDDNTLRLDGVYVDLAYTLESTQHWRTWLAGRAEWLDVRANSAAYASHGFALRVASELFAQTVAADGHGGGFGVIAGTLALGLYVEASHRDLPPELGPDAVTAGLSLRVPFILAAVN